MGFAMLLVLLLGLLFSVLSGMGDFSLLFDKSLETDTFWEFGWEWVGEVGWRLEYMQLAAVVLCISGGPPGLEKEKIISKHCKSYKKVSN